MSRSGFRVAAFGIAALAVVDPSFSASRSTRPVVAVVASTGDRALSDRVAAVLERRFTIVSGLTDMASATVLVGALPDEAALPAGPMFAVVRRASATDIRITHLDVPTGHSLHSRLLVGVHMYVAGAQGRNVSVDAWTGNVNAGTVMVPIGADTGVSFASLPLVPARGPQLLRVTAQVDGGIGSDTAVAVLEGRDQRLRVLFFDGRPSWNATFVRRALESDSRFSVAHRVLTSRGLANTRGAAPASLGDFDSLRDYAAIVVGAPDLLTTADIDGLESFMRLRGGRVVLLMETRPTIVLERLTGASNWRTLQSAAPSTITDSAVKAVLRARDIIWPATLAEETTVRAAALGRDSVSRAIIWSVPVGAGRLIVSGARDAWHYRGDSAGFHAFWLSTIAENAMLSPSPIEIQLARQVVAPGSEITARVTLRDVFIAGRGSPTSRVRASLVSNGDSTPVRLLPSYSPGEFSGRFVAPGEPASYRLVVEAGADRHDVPIIVDPMAVSPRPDDRAAIEAFVSSRGGSLVEDPELNSLPDLVASAVRSVSRVETWHPMRSGWWIVPFALLLGTEWWWRRRHGSA